MITIENLDNTYDHGVSPTNNDYSPNRSQKTTSKNEEDKFVKITRKYLSRDVSLSQNDLVL